MTKVGFQVQKRVVMAVTAMCIMMSGCEDRLDSRGGNPPEEGKPVDVTLRIGLEDEVDAYDLSATASPTKAGASGDKAAFSFDLQPSAQTRAGEGASLKPDALYNLEIRQYDANGTYKGGSAEVVASAAIGSAIEVKLTEATKCQLVLVAWGSGNSTRLNSVSLKDAQKISVDVSWISSLNPIAQADMNKMPYMLHLKDVNVSQDGHIYSQDGEAIDIRLRLQRLAARLNVTWDYSVSIDGADYQMNQILLQSIPLNYNVIPAPDAASDNTYPSLLDQFTTIQLKEVKQKGSYSCWIPANVRGTNPNATTLNRRIKSNAPIGSSYIDFQAVNQDSTIQKLSYRVYLGGNDTRDFNLYGNRDYSYSATFTHSTMPYADERVTVTDPIPASKENKNLVPTANCFMVAPGGAFCFDPYTYQVEGSNKENTTLTNWAKDEGGIAYVKLLWQTKENGDVGDPVIGVANSAADHTNLVDIKRTDGTDVNIEFPLATDQSGRIYCRVAPNTTGGSGLIAAYNKSNEIIWSWHIWVTDYSPASTGNGTIQKPANKRKLKFTNHDANQLPMMDRNLGAIAGFMLNDPPKNDLDKSKANGMHFQWGRKDPFPGSYSATPIDKITGLTSAMIAPKGMLNRYGPDGISYLASVTESVSQTLRDAYKMPDKYIMTVEGKYGWCSSGEETMRYLWEANDKAKTKGLHDPCPAGWRVVAQSDLNALSLKGNISNKQEPNASNATTAVDDGGLYLYYEGNSSGPASYFRLPGYRRTTDTFEFIGLRWVIWMRAYSAKGENNYYSNGFDVWYKENKSLGTYGVTQDFSVQDGHVTRCIQERE